jgi:hypothetical protein
MSVTLFAQVKKTKKLSAEDQAKIIHQMPTMQVMKMTKFSPRKIMIQGKYVWVFATNTTKGHWASLAVNEKEKFNQLLTKGDTMYSLNLNNYKRTYMYTSRTTSAIPNKAFEVDKFEEHPEWITKRGSLVRKDGASRLEMKGASGKTNVYYHKNINLLLMNFSSYNKYDLPETNTAFTDHIIVTDTLFIPSDSYGFLNIKRRKRGYVKIIANCIIYDRPIKVNTTSITTDFVFSAKKILLKTPYKDLTKTELNPAPPFIMLMNKKQNMIEGYIDPFAENEMLLINRLMINMMIQIATELQIANDNYWKKDKLLEKFQSYRGRVNTKILVSDSDYLNRFKDICNEFDNKYEKEIIDTKRTIGELVIIVDGKIGDLPQKPFKYYAVPSKATLVPMMDENTSELTKLGNLLFRDSDDSKLSVTMEVKLGYQKEILEKANKELNKYGFTLEKAFPKKILFIVEQPLQIRGQKIGKIIPIDSDILELKLELQDEGLSLIKLLAKNDVSFPLNFKAYDSRNEFPQNILFEVSDEVIERIDYENMIGEFNVIETNTITDLVKITSNLTSDLGEENGGTLNYIEVSLEFLFENEKVVFRGPFKMSSASVLGSEKSILFIKHSENYSIKVTGKAYYENGIREIKDDYIINSPFIELQEDMFNDNILKN